MEEWIRCNIGDVCKTISDTYRGNADEVVLVNTSDVLEGKCLNHQKSPNKDLKGQFKKTFQKDDILYSEIRPANKRFAYIDFDGTDYIASTKLMVIRHNENIIPQFLYYVITSQTVIEELQMLAESRSGTFPQITFSELASLPIALPPLSEQKKIVRLLKSLDDKIEVNRQINDNFVIESFFQILLIWMLTTLINDNLEQQAQTLFKSWFVDFDPFKNSEFVDSELGMIPKGWRVGTLSEVANITMGASPSGTSYNVNGDGAVFYQGRAEFGYRFPHRNMFTTEPKRFAEKGDVLLSVRAPVGDVNVANERCCIGRGLAAIKSDSSPSYILYLLKSLKPIFDQYNGEGTVFGCINKNTLEGLRTIIPEIGSVEKFESIVSSIDEQIMCREEESGRLASLRNAMLPKLMLGELIVEK